jgi:hypothetical protein
MAVNDYGMVVHHCDIFEPHKECRFYAVIYSGNFTTLAPERTRVERVTVLHSEHRLVALLVNIGLG